MWLRYNQPSAAYSAFISVYFQSNKQPKLSGFIVVLFDKKNYYQLLFYSQQNPLTGS